jgi:hypothetical protein
MHVVFVKMTSVILRSDNIWLKVLLGKKSIFTSTALWKEDNTLEESSKPSTDQKNRKTIRQLIAWRKTDLALFGPLIKEKKTKKKKEKTAADPVKVDNPIGNLLPINLLNASTVKLNLKAHNSPKSGDVVELVVPTTDNTSGPGDTKSFLSLKTPKESSNKVPPKTKSLIENVKDITFAENILPSTPFFKKDEIIHPFPMVLLKECSPPNSKEILTIASAKVDVPSVTQVLSKTMSDKSEMMLALWRKRKIAEVGEEGLKEFMRG